MHLLLKVNINIVFSKPNIKKYKKNWLLFKIHYKPVEYFLTIYIMWANLESPWIWEWFEANDQATAGVVAKYGDKIDALIARVASQDRATIRYRAKTGWRKGTTIKNNDFVRKLRAQKGEE